MYFILFTLFINIFLLFRETLSKTMSLAYALFLITFGLIVYLSDVICAVKNYANMALLEVRKNLPNLQISINCVL